MVLKLYGYPMSPYTRLVILVCREKEIPYEFVNIDLMKGDQKDPGYLQCQPFGQAPYIDDDGFILYESRAIARYLIRKYPNQGTTGLIPTDLREEALFEQACSVEVAHYNAQISPLVFETVYKQMLFGTQTDEAKAAELLKSFEAKLNVYETILGRQRYMAGDCVTLADLQHLGLGSALCSAYPDVFEKRPNVGRWWEEIYNRPAWQAVKDF